MIDPRHSVIESRLAPAQRIVAVTGGKGGIGKTLVSATLALSIAASGRRAGLLDLDFTTPCAHLVIGAGQRFPDEDFGITPPTIAGVDFMSVACFAGQTPAPLRGADVTNALIELLAITRWPPLDVLVIDMPPGLGDLALDAVQLLPRAEYLVVASASKLVAQTVDRALGLLTGLDRPIVGLVENLADGATREPSIAIAELVARHDVEVVAHLPRDASIEGALGDPAALRQTAFGQAVSRLAEQL